MLVTRRRTRRRPSTTPRSASMVSQKKQVKRLKKDAQRLWDDQQALLTRANSVARDARPHAQHFARAPSTRWSPARAPWSPTPEGRPRRRQDGKAAGTYAASTAKDALTGVLLPAVTSAAAAAMALAEEAGDRLGLGDTDLATQGKKAAEQLGMVTTSGPGPRRRAREAEGRRQGGKAAAKPARSRSRRPPARRRASASAASSASCSASACWPASATRSGRRSAPTTTCGSPTRTPTPG